MTIVALDALQLNDLDWSALDRFGGATRYDATPTALVVERARGAELADSLAKLEKLKARFEEALQGGED